MIKYMKISPHDLEYLMHSTCIYLILLTLALLDSDPLMYILNRADYSPCGSYGLWQVYAAFPYKVYRCCPVP